MTNVGTMLFTTLGVVFVTSALATCEPWCYFDEIDCSWFPTSCGDCKSKCDAGQGDTPSYGSGSGASNEACESWCDYDMYCSWYPGSCGGCEMCGSGTSTQSGYSSPGYGPDYEKWSCEKCNSDPDYQYCKWDGPTIGCLPKKDDGHHIPCGQIAGDVMIDKCPSGDWTSLAHRLLSKEQLERFAKAVGDESAEMLRTLPNPGTLPACESWCDYESYCSWYPGSCGGCEMCDAGSGTSTQSGSSSPGYGSGSACENWCDYHYCSWYPDSCGGCDMCDAGSGSSTQSGYSSPAYGSGSGAHACESWCDYDMYCSWYPGSCGGCEMCARTDSISCNDINKRSKCEAQDGCVWNGKSTLGKYCVADNADCGDYKLKSSCTSNNNCIYDNGKCKNNSGSGSEYGSSLSTGSGSGLTNECWGWWCTDVEYCSSHAYICGGCQMCDDGAGSETGSDAVCESWCDYEMYCSWYPGSCGGCEMCEVGGKTCEGWCNYEKYCDWYPNFCGGCDMCDEGFTCSVTLYQHDYFEGESKSYGVGNVPQVWWNDEVSSIKVVGHGCTAIVYEHENYKGWSVTLTEGSYDLWDLDMKGFKNDQVTSMKVTGNGGSGSSSGSGYSPSYGSGYGTTGEPTQHPAFPPTEEPPSTACSVTLYQHDYFEGRSESYYVGNVPQVFWNNEVSSIKVVGHGCTAIVYEHENYQGWSVTLTEGSYDLWELEWKGFKNDQMSSMKVTGNAGSGSLNGSGYSPSYDSGYGMTGEPTVDPAYPPTEEPTSSTGRRRLAKQIEEEIVALPRPEAQDDDYHNQRRAETESELVAPNAQL